MYPADADAPEGIALDLVDEVRRQVLAPTNFEKVCLGSSAETTARFAWIMRPSSSCRPLARPSSMRMRETGAPVITAPP
jgi:hypothetical protein